MIDSLFDRDAVRNGVDVAKPVPLYRQIADFLRERIASGTLREGTNLSPERELAECFGVSLITTKKALRLLVREGLIYRRPNLGTFVRGGSARKARLAALCFVFCHDGRELAHTHGLIFSGVEDACREKGIRLHFIRVPEHAGTAQDSLLGGCEGVILEGMVHPPVCAWLRKRETPFVVAGYLSEKWKGEESLYQVVTRPQDIVRQALAYLETNGHRKVALINGPRRLPYYDRMERDFEETDPGARRGLKLVARADALYPNGERVGYTAAARILKAKPTALICANDLIAVGAMKRLKDSGMRVPEDVSIVTVGTSPLAQLTHPPLTSIEVDVFGFGRAAVELLEEVVAGRADGKKRVWNRTAVVERESVSGVAAGRRAEMSRVRS